MTRARRAALLFRGSRPPRPRAARLPHCDRLTALVAMVFVAVSGAARAAGQEPVETRAEEVQAKRRAKAAQLRPYEPNRIESALFEIEDTRFFTRIFNPPYGMFGVVGGPGEGSGFGGGAGYRIGTEDRHLSIATTATFKQYWEVDARARADNFAAGRAYAELGVRYHDAPMENFFGLGPASALGDRTNYTLTMTTLSGGGGVSITPETTIAGTVEYLRPRVASGGSDRHPSIEDRFTDLDAPGLVDEPQFLHAEARLEYEGRDQPGNPRRGGRYVVAWGRAADLDEDRYAFQRVMVDIQQVIPFWSEQRRFMLRGVAVQTDPDAGRDVPFYLMPALGGGNTLRAFKTDRFRDRAAVLLRTEYQYQLNAFLYAALFADAGQVAPTLRAMERRRFERNYGFGLRFGAATVVLRADVAFGGGEGTRFVLRFGGL